ncbi:MAG: WG repeat-containing protein [Bacteroidia bacterium]|jgi:tetratricopeptide (TPR) repeat protein
MYKLRIILLCFVLSFAAMVKASPIKKAFTALKVYNYFEAKKNFEKALKKEVAAATYGLSNIFYRNDNPFFNIDSAYKYILLSDDAFQVLSEKKKTGYQKYSFTQQAIDSVKNEIFKRAFDVYKKNNSIAELNKFIEHYPGAPQRNDAIDLRNSIAYHEARKKDTYQAYQSFISTYPKAKEVPQAHERYEQTYYQASTKNKSLKEYEDYLQKRPNTPFLAEVENAIYNLSTTEGTIKEYHDFIKRHPGNRNVEAAWKQIYTMYTADYKTESLVDFKLEFPDYPYSDVVNLEIVMSQKPLFGVRENGKWGFADSTGKVMIPCTYEWVEEFAEGVAECGLSGKAGFVNKTGKLIIPCIYDQVEPFYHGLAIVQQNGKSGVINKIGKTVVPFEYDEISEFSEGLAAVLKQDKYGYIDESGRQIIPLKFTKAADFSEGLAAVELNGKSGYINSTGDVVIPCKFDWVEKFSNAIAKVRIDKKFGIINKAGLFLIPCEYDFIGEFSEDAFLVVNDNKYGFTDKDGNLFIPLDYDYNGTYMATFKFKNGVAVAEKNKKQGLINKAGKYVTPKDFARIEPFSEGLAAAKKKEKWGYIDEKMKVQVPYNFSAANEFISGMAKVTDKNGNIGFIDKSGKPVIELQFDEAGTFKNGWCTVVIDEKTGIIDLAGSWILPCELDVITQVKENILRLEKNSRLAYFNILTRNYFWKEEGF